MKNKTCCALLSPPFLLSLFLLLVNDHILKVLWPNNFFIGKLSDLSGLWAFYYFLRACLGTERISAYFTVVSLFLLWKSALFDLPLELFNSYSPLLMGREKDLSDLFALLVLPLAERSFRKQISRDSSEPNSVYAYFVAGLSCFAFAATSQMKIPALPEFTSQEQAEEFQRQLQLRRHFDLDGKEFAEFPLPLKRAEYQNRLREKGFLIDETLCVDCHFQGWFYHTFNIRAVRADFLDTSLRSRKSWSIVSDENCPLVGGFHVELTVESNEGGSIVKIRNADFCSQEVSPPLEFVAELLKDACISSIQERGESQ